MLYSLQNASSLLNRTTRFWRYYVNLVTDRMLFAKALAPKRIYGIPLRTGTCVEQSEKSRCIIYTVYGLVTLIQHPYHIGG